MSEKKRADRIAPLEPRLLTKVEATNYLRVRESTFTERFKDKLQVVVLDDKQKHPLYDIRDLDELIDKNKGYLPDDYS